MTTPPDKTKNRELAPREWEALRLQWITSGRPHVWRFLAEQGHPNRTGGLRKRVQKWLLLDEVKAVSEPVDNVVHLPKGLKTGAGGGSNIGEKGAVVPEVMGPSQGPGATQVLKREDPFQLVLEWREKQALADYRSAERIRTSINLYLQDSVQKVPHPDQVKNKGEFVYKTSLKPGEARQVAQALEAVQRVQRLALGLSTDNIGVSMGGGHGGKEAPSGSEVEKPALTEESIPTFVVEMNRGGKFVRARPRRAQ